MKLIPTPLFQGQLMAPNPQRATVTSSPPNDSFTPSTTIEFGAKSSKPEVKKNLHNRKSVPTDGIIPDLILNQVEGASETGGDAPVTEGGNEALQTPAIDAAVETGDQDE